MNKNEPLSVSQVARLARVTVRTLHHYDEIGLLVPSERTDAGYRRYTAEDLARLQQILLHRELGFPLEAIRRLLDEPAQDRKEALRAQRARLVEQLDRTHAILRALDATLEALEGGEMDFEKMFEGFDPAQYEDEAKQRWGETDAYKESMRRTKRYTKEDWAAIKAEGDGIVEDWAALLAAGHAPDDEAALDVAERHREHIARWFYPCAPSMHAGLADMYEADERFAAFYEKRAAGLTAFVSASIRANAARAGG